MCVNTALSKELKVWVPTSHLLNKWNRTVITPAKHFAKAQKPPRAAAFCVLLALHITQDNPLSAFLFALARLSTSPFSCLLLDSQVV